MCTHLDKVGSTYYFRRAVPDDLLGVFYTKTGKPRTEWKFSLRTKDREEAKRLRWPHVSATDNLIGEARAALAFAGEASPTDLVAERRVREEREAAAQLAEESAARQAARSPERVRMRRRLLLSTAQLEPHEAAVADLMREKDAEIAILQAAAAARNEETASVPVRDGRPEKATPAVSIKTMFEDYAASGAAVPHTVAKWRAAVTAFTQHLGHDNAAAVTRTDFSTWLKALVASGLSVSTVKGTYRAAVARVFKLAHGDGLLGDNVTAAMEVRGPKAVKIRRNDISDDEAKLILRAALNAQCGNIGEHHALARRWVPWICAYTGSRIAEITQMRACDILQEDGVWVFRITPDAGGIKDNSFRLVPVHPHLVEQGILRLAKANDRTPLFYDPALARSADTVQKQPQQLGSKLGAWVRALGVTQVASPNHGWRHRFKTTARLVGIPADVRDAIQGHVARTQGEKYGETPLAILREAIERLPRYELGEFASAS